MTHISEVLLEMLVRDGMSVGSGGTGATQGMGAGMLEGTAHPLTAQAQGEDASRSGMGKAGAAKAPASALELVSNNAREPSPATGRPVLQLIIGGSSKPSRAGKAQLRLVLN